MFITQKNKTLRVLQLLLHEEVLDLSRVITFWLFSYDPFDFLELVAPDSTFDVLVVDFMVISVGDDSG
jgi:hypothetical protein